MIEAGDNRPMLEGLRVVDMTSAPHTCFMNRLNVPCPDVSSVNGSGMHTARGGTSRTPATFLQMPDAGDDKPLRTIAADMADSEHSIDESAAVY